MPKKVDYPHCSFTDAIEIAEVVKTAGGKAPIGYVADGLNMSESGGGFRGKINGATKYGFVSKSDDGLILTELADQYFHPISENDRQQALIQAFRSVPLFNDLLERLSGQEIDKNILENMLIRIYDVNRKVASKVAGYFLKGNEIVQIMEERPGNTYFVPDIKKLNYRVPLDNQDEEEIDEVDPPDNPKTSDTSMKKINEDIFDLLIHLGNLIHNPDASDDSLKIVREIIDNNRNQLSHSELFVDLMDIKNEKIITKLSHAMKKDLGIKDEE